MYMSGAVTGAISVTTKKARAATHRARLLGKTASTVAGAGTAARSIVVVLPAITSIPATDTSAWAFVSSVRRVKSGSSPVDITTEQEAASIFRTEWIKINVISFVWPELMRSIKMNLINGVYA